MRVQSLMFIRSKFFEEGPDGAQELLLMMYTGIIPSGVWGLYGGLIPGWPHLRQGLYILLHPVLSFWPSHSSF